MYKTLIALFLMIQSIYASNFTWGAFGLVLHGEKEPVLKLSKDIAEFYKVDQLERMINRLEAETKHFNIPLELYANIESEKENLKERRIRSYNYLWGNLFDQNGFILLDSEELEDLLKAQVEKKVQFKNFKEISIRARADKLKTMIDRMNLIYENSIGRKLFDDIQACAKKGKHTLLIYDDKSSLSGGGYTGGNPSTFNIFVPGKGESAEIRMRFDQPDEGAHQVVSVEGTKIPFLAIDNIFHELVHAKHVMCGTTSKANAEAQAITEENQFRRSRGETADWPDRDARAYEEGEQVWYGLF